ncbi:hypothetical protein ACFS2C_21435 [Prauserella oleivorans]|uniref:Uncharacterized protein n=1 Tax=Prauserella oleivorans TaxID=1478153 RepID=A0ABW5WHU2_9PSEU
MSKHHARGTAAVLLLFAAGCGVQPTGVITGASPPSGAALESAAVIVYLLRNGELAATPRDAEPRSRADTLALLANGPTDEERARGLTSEVPGSAAPFSVSAGPAGTVVTVSRSVDALSDTAIGQIVCTAGGPGEYVTVRGDGRSRGPLSCPVTG